MLSKLTVPPSLRALIYFIMFTSLVAGGMFLERYFWKGKEAKNEVEVLKEDNAVVERVDEEYRGKVEELNNRLEVLREKVNSDSCYNTVVTDELREPESSQQGKPIDETVRSGKPTR